MDNRKVNLVAASLTLLLLVPVVNAFHPFASPSENDLLDDIYGVGESGRVIQYTQDAGTIRSDGGNASDSVFSSTLHTLTRVNTSHWLIKVFTFIEFVDGGDGEQNVSIQIDGVNVPGCHATYTTDSTPPPGDFRSVNIAFTCPVMAPSFGSHDLSVNFTTASGTPGARRGMRAAYEIERQDFVTEPAFTTVDLTTSVDEFIPFLIFGSLVVLFTVRGSLFPAVMALIATSTYLFTPQLMSLETNIMLVLIGIITQAIARSFLRDGAN